MQLTKSYTKNYNEFNDNFQFILPLNLENLIPEDDSVRLLSHVFEGLDYTKLLKLNDKFERVQADYIFSSAQKNVLDLSIFLGFASAKLE